MNDDLKWAHSSKSVRCVVYWIQKKKNLLPTFTSVWKSKSKKYCEIHIHFGFFRSFVRSMPIKNWNVFNRFNRFGLRVEEIDLDENNFTFSVSSCIRFVSSCAFKLNLIAQLWCDYAHLCAFYLLRPMNTVASHKWCTIENKHSAAAAFANMKFLCPPIHVHTHTKK